MEHTSLKIHFDLIWINDFRKFKTFLCPGWLSEFLPDVIAHKSIISNRQNVESIQIWTSKWTNCGIFK